MPKLKLEKNTKKAFVTYFFTLLLFAAVMISKNAGMLSNTMTSLLVPACVYIVAALSLNLTVGILGELSLGHAGFMSVGAFSGATVAIALKDVIASDALRLLIALFVGAFFAALVGFIVGIPVLRLNGDYLAIVTLAFGEIIKTLVTNLYIGKDIAGLHFGFLNNDLNMQQGGKMILNGPNGISGIQKISTPLFGFLLIFVTLIVIFNLVNSRSGRAILAVRDNQIAAESVGINTTKYKLMAFVISASLAGAAGALYALCQNTVTASKFDFNTSILLLVFVVLGGLGNMMGSIISALVLYLLPETLLRQFAEYRMLIYAIVLILVMLATNSPAGKSIIEKAETRMKAILKKFGRKSKKTEKGADAQ